MNRTRTTGKVAALRVRFILDATGDRATAGRWLSMLAGEIGGVHRLHHEHTGMNRTRTTGKVAALRVRFILDATGDRGDRWPWRSMLAGEDRRRSLTAPRAHRHGPHQGDGEGSGAPGPVHPRRDRRSWRLLAGEIGGAHRLHHEHTGMDRTRATVKAPALRVRLSGSGSILDATGDRGDRWPWRSMLAGEDRRRSLTAPRAHRHGPHQGDREGSGAPGPALRVRFHPRRDRRSGQPLAAGSRC
jgi:hypothetical protein